MHLSILPNNFIQEHPVEIALLIAGVALVFAIRRWRQVVVRRNKIESSMPRAVHTELANPLNVREVATELSALLADLEETTRRAVAQIENRRIALELLLKEADEKIQALEAFSGTSSRTADSIPSPSAGPATGRVAANAAAPASHDAAQLISRLRQERGAPLPTEDPACFPIYQLADAGKTPREIAQQLSRQPGEVELILALRKRQHV